MSTTLDQHSVTARVTPLALTLYVDTGSVTLDEGWSPYAQAQLVCKLPDADAMEALDLRTIPLRLDLRARQDFGTLWSLAVLTADYAGSMAALTVAFGGKPLSAVYTKYSHPWNTFGRRPSTSRRFDLVITERIFDHVAGELRITAASGEALLQSDALIATATFDPGTTSVKTIVGLVLDRLDATLQPGAPDATVEAAATIWSPGVSAWDYVAPLCQAANLKLWCDEVGRWWLTEVQPTTPGALVLTEGVTITEGTDTMSVASDVWFDAVVVVYKWTDSFDLNNTAYDVAGPTHPRNVYRVEHNTPYPGPGAAAGILNRAQGRGRTLDVAAVSDYRARPGQAATITLPNTEIQTGYVASVAWGWPDNEMRVASRGLVDTPETSWLFTPTGISWLAIPAGTSWNAFTPIGA